MKKHIGSLLGRTFLLTQPHTAKHWGGIGEDAQGKNDYNALDDYDLDNEGILDYFEKSPGVTYYTFFSYPTKIEIFTIEKGFIICDGLLLNQSWDYSQELIFKKIEELNFKINISSGGIFIFEAPNSGSVLPDIDDNTSSYIGITKDDVDSFVYIKLINGLYNVSKIHVKVQFLDEEIELPGVKIEM